MKVAPIRYEFCANCSIKEDKIKSSRDIEHTNTVQYLREIKVPNSRSCWGVRHPIMTYICSECGGENLG